jgi:hypothetical protein
MRKKHYTLEERYKYHANQWDRFDTEVRRSKTKNKEVLIKRKYHGLIADIVYREKKYPDKKKRKRLYEICENEVNREPRDARYGD